MMYTGDIVCGVDIGSVATKTVIFDRKGNKILSCAIDPTGPNPQLIAQQTLNKAINMVGDISKETIKYIISTGYARRCVKFGHKTITEITACAKGITWVAKKMGLLPPITIIDLGGQDTKVISLDESGEISDFVMNDRCAAGTGKFLEIIATRLNISVEDLSHISEKSKEPQTINSTCAVFAEAEVVSLLAQNKNIEDIVAGIHLSIVERLYNMVSSISNGGRELIFFCGGGAKNMAIHKLLQEKLNKKIFLPSPVVDAQFVVALGAALLSPSIRKK